MKGFKDNIEKETLANEHFRKVLYTGRHLQLVLMSLKAGEDIGEETHPDTDQFFRFEFGSGTSVIDGHEYSVAAGDVIVVPAGAKHNIINTGTSAPLKMYTLYGPPNHQDGTLRATKIDAQKRPEAFDGKTTENISTADIH